MKFTAVFGAVAAARISREGHTGSLGAQVTVSADGSLSKTLARAADDTRTRRQRLALLQARAEEMAKAKLSPDAKSVIDTALLPTLKEEIQGAVLREFTTTQDMLSGKVAGLQSKNSASEQSQGVATKQDKALDECRTAEVGLMRELEQCVSDREAKIKSDAEACEQQRAAAVDACAARDAAADIELSALCIETKCNLADGNSCGVNAYKTIMDGVAATVAEKERVYNQKSAVCSKAQDDAATTCAAAEQYSETDSCASQREVLGSKTSTCDHSSESASVAICSFGGDLKSKCADLSEVNELVAEIKGSSREDSLSEPDRQAEWAAVQRLTCLLEALRDDGDLSTEATAACADARKYPRTFDYMAEAIAAINCDQQSFSFSGYSWIMGSTADQCSRSAATLPFSSGADQQAFPVCGENPNTQLLLGEGSELVKGTSLGEVHASQNYEVSFVVTPHQTRTGWANLIHFTQSGKNCCDEGDRMPAAWFFTDTTRLHIRSGRKDGGNDGCDPTEQLPLGKATKVDIRVAEGKMQVFYAGSKVCETSTYGSPTVPAGTMVAYAADPWHYAALATVSHLSYTRL
mmetsp:Transcript_90024/g.205750  ORF Transcript_90024/g.205750 Transcript_90024/m.205750 type:complete len:579 (+) Transcript_90024:59-1795(+)